MAIDEAVKEINEEIRKLELKRRASSDNIDSFVYSVKIVAFRSALEILEKHFGL